MSELVVLIEAMTLGGLAAHFEPCES